MEEEDLEEVRNLEEVVLEVTVLKEAVRTDLGTAQEEEVCLHEEDQPEEEGGPVLEEEAQEVQGEQEVQEEVSEDPAYHQGSAAEVLQDQEVQGNGLGPEVQDTCPCLGSPWGTHENLQEAQPYLLLTSVLTECLSFYETASQTDSETVCYTE